MKKLSEIYKELGIDFTFPIKIEDTRGNETYFENSYGCWYRYEYDKDGNKTYFEDSDDYWERREYDKEGNSTYFESSNGFWIRREYDENGKVTYFETSKGIERGTKRGSCSGKVVEIDGKKYKLTEL